MLTREQVKKMARYSYARGVELYQQKKVRSMQMEEEKQYLYIDCLCEGQRTEAV